MEAPINRSPQQQQQQQQQLPSSSSCVPTTAENNNNNNNNNKMQQPFSPPVTSMHYTNTSRLESTTTNTSTLSCTNDAPNNNNNINNNNNDVTILQQLQQQQQQEKSIIILEKFAILLGTSHQNRTKELIGLLSKSVTDDQVVLMVPALEIQSQQQQSLPSSSSSSTAAAAVTTAVDGNSGNTGSSSNNSSSIQDILPQMGRHNSLGALSSTLSNSSLFHMTQQVDIHNELRPSMAASVLNMASSTTTTTTTIDPENQQSSQPQSIHKTTEFHHNTEGQLADASIQTTAQNIGKQTSWTKSTVPYATNAVGNNITESFTTLFNSRLRAWTLILLRHSLSTGSNDSRSKLLGMLSVKINITSYESIYRTLPLPEAAKNAKPIDSDIILPLLFEVTLNISIQEKIEKVILRAPGTISGILDDFATASTTTTTATTPVLLLKKVNVQLDTGVFLKSMVDQARMIVLKAVSSATETQLSPQPNALSTTTTTTMTPLKSSTSAVAVSSKVTTPTNTDSGIVKNNKGIPTPLSVTPRNDGAHSTSSSVPKQRPTTTELERMAKTRKSALRLNSVLHGKTLKGSVSSITLGGSGGSGGSTSGMQQQQQQQQQQNDPSTTMRKVTSIRWDNSIPNPKFTSVLTLSPNISITPGVDRKKNKLESYKSFGRPHGGDFGSGPRNATFGEYGRPAFAGAWGRDGRLMAHPMPRKNSAVDSNGNLVGGSADLNATFDNVVPTGKKRAYDSTQYLSQGMDGGTTAAHIGTYRSSAASAGAALLGRLSNPPAGSSNSSISSTGSSNALLQQQQQHSRISESNLHRTATALENSLMKKWS